MPAIIHPITAPRLPGARPAPDYRTPHYDCTELPTALTLTLYVPGVDAHGVELVARGPDLIVTARKTTHLRANWPALHLEKVQRDYQLKLRLGLGFNFEATQAPSPGACSPSWCRRTGRHTPARSTGSAKWPDPDQIRRVRPPPTGRACLFPVFFWNKPGSYGFSA